MWYSYQQSPIDDVQQWFMQLIQNQVNTTVGIVISTIVGIVVATLIVRIIRSRRLPADIQALLVRMLQRINPNISETEVFVLHVEEAQQRLYTLKPQYKSSAVQGFFQDRDVQRVLLTHHPLIDEAGRLRQFTASNESQARVKHDTYTKAIVSIYTTYRQAQSSRIRHALPDAREFAHWWNQALLETIEKQYSLYEQIVKLKLDEIAAQLRKMQSFESSIADYFRIVKPSYQPASQEAVQAFYSGRSMLSWEIVAAGAVVPRQQRDDFIARYGSEIPTQVELVCVTGEMGEGKTTFLWDVAYEIKQKLDCVLVQCIVTDPAAWGKLANAVNDERLPVIVIVDDVFVSDSFKQAMYAVAQVNLPIRILATSRSYDLPKYDQFAFDNVQLNPPTRTEIDSLISRFAQTVIDDERRQSLYKVKSWLVLMMEMSSGSEFQNVVIQSLEYLRRQDQHHYLAYLYVCFVSQYNIAVPRDLLSALHPEFRNVQIPGYIFDLEKTRSGSVVRAAHAEIARVVSEHMQLTMNYVEIFGAYLAHADFAKQSHRYMVGMLGAALIRSNKFEPYGELFAPQQPHMQQWLTKCTHVEVFNQITTILYALNAESALAPLYRRMLATVPQNVSDWRSLLMYADRAQQKVSFNIITALKNLANTDQQDAGVWDLVVTYLNADRSNQYAAQQLIPLIASMIGSSPLIRAQYLELVERFGSNDHVNDAVTRATSWLSLNEVAPKLMIAYARLVVVRQISHTIKHHAITVLQPFIPLDDAFTKVHPELFQYYIELLQQTNQHAQITQTMQTISTFVQQTQWNPYVFRKYILLASLVGSDADKRQALVLMADAIVSHKEDITSPTMNTVWYMVDQLYPRGVRIDIPAYVQTMKPLLLAVPAWLMINTNHKIHSKYLTAVSRTNDRDIRRVALQLGETWIQNTPIEQIDLFVFTGYCKLYSGNFIDRSLFIHMLRIAEYIFAANEDDSHIRSNVALLLNGRNVLLVHREVNEIAVRLVMHICAWIGSHEADIRLLKTVLLVVQVINRRDVTIHVLPVILKWCQADRDPFADLYFIILFLRLVQDASDSQIASAVISFVIKFDTVFSDTEVFRLFYSIFERYATVEQRDMVISSFHTRLCVDPTDASLFLLYLQLIRTHTQSSAILVALQDQYNWRLIHLVPEIQEAYIKLVVEYASLADMTQVKRTIVFWQNRNALGANVLAQMQQLGFSIA